MKIYNKGQARHIGAAIMVTFIPQAWWLVQAEQDNRENIYLCTISFNRYMYQI